MFGWTNLLTIVNSTFTFLVYWCYITKIMMQKHWDTFYCHSTKQIKWFNLVDASWMLIFWSVHVSQDVICVVKCKPLIQYIILLSIPLGAGQFDRSLYLEGIRRRITRELKKSEAAMKNQDNSTVCTISWSGTTGTSAFRVLKLIISNTEVLTWKAGHSGPKDNSVLQISSAQSRDKKTAAGQLVL